MNKNILHDIKTRQGFRNWLSANHAVETECWVFVTGRFPLESSAFCYLDAVEESLCFGWIDSVVKRLPDFGLAQRISPRKKKSPWSELNKERCRRLEKIGLMTSAGRSVLPDLSIESFIIDNKILNELQKNEQIWNNFQNFPPLYQRVRIDYIQRTKKNKAMFERRLRHFIKKTEKNIMFGEWSDRGRLLEY